MLPDEDDFSSLALIMAFMKNIVDFVHILCWVPHAYNAYNFS
jgi:hypothetical protein